MIGRSGEGLQVLAASPSDLDLCAVHVVAHASGVGTTADLARALHRSDEIGALRDKGYVATASARGAGVVTSAIAPAHAAREVAESLARAIARSDEQIPPTPSSPKVTETALAQVIGGGDGATLPSVALGAAPRSVVLVAPQAALPRADDIRPLTVGGIDAARHRVPVPVDGPVFLALPPTGRVALEVVAVLDPWTDARDTFARSLLSTALAGHHSGLVTTAVDAALRGGYDVSSTLDVVAGVDVLRLSVGVRDSALLAPVYSCLARVLDDLAALLRRPGVLDGARAHAAAAYEASRASLVALAEGITSFVAQGLPVEDFDRAGDLIAATRDDDVIRTSAALSPARRVVVLHGATEQAQDAVRALVRQTPGGAE